MTFCAFEGVRPWKGAQPDEFYTEDWHRPREMYEHGAEQTSDEDLKDAEQSFWPRSAGIEE